MQKILIFLGLIIRSFSGNPIFVRPGTPHDRFVLPQNSPFGPLEEPRIAQKGKNGTKQTNTICAEAPLISTILTHCAMVVKDAKTEESNEAKASEDVVVSFSRTKFELKRYSGIYQSN